MFQSSIARFRTVVCLAGSLLISTVVAAADVRTWVDSSGKHRVEAEFISFNNGVVTLRSAAGKEIKLPLARLSTDDQAFVRQQLPPSADSPAKPAKPAAKPAQPAGKPAAAKPLAKRFYNALIDQNFDEIKTLLTPAAQSNWDAAKTSLEGLDVPDNRQAVLVRTATANDDVVDVNVSIKVRGKFQKQHLRCRWAEGEWRVAALIPDGEDTDPITFEAGGSDDTGAASSAEDEDEDADADADEDDEADAEASPPGRRKAEASRAKDDEDTGDAEDEKLSAFAPHGPRGEIQQRR